MSKDHIWAAFWVIFFSLVAITIISCVAINAHDNAKMRDSIDKMVAAGASPIAARCAAEGMSGTSTAQNVACVTQATIDAQLGAINGQSPTVHQ